MESEVKHREISKECATVETGKVPSKQHRDRHLTAGCREKPKERTWVNGGSRRKLAAACRRVSRCARVAWRKRNIITNNLIRDKVERGTWRVGMLRKKLWTHHGGRRGRKSIGGKGLLFLRNEWTTAIGIRGWSSGQRPHLGGETLYTTIKKTLYEINSMKIVKQKAASPKIEDWALWRGRPPQKWKNETAHRAGARDVGAPAALGNFAPLVGKRKKNFG
jgi:hypothetical protein